MREVDALKRSSLTRDARCADHGIGDIGDGLLTRVDTSSTVGIHSTTIRIASTTLAGSRATLREPLCETSSFNG